MPRIIGETPSERETRESIRDELDMLQRKLGNRVYIDEFTTVIDTRTTTEIMAREPKCVIAHKMRQEKKNENNSHGRKTGN
jgi:hypothetical protein